MRPSMMSLKLLHVNTPADLLFTHFIYCIIYYNVVLQAFSKGNPQDV